MKELFLPATDIHNKIKRSSEIALNEAKREIDRLDYKNREKLLKHLVDGLIGEFEEKYNNDYNAWNEFNDGKDFRNPDLSEKFQEKREDFEYWKEKKEHYEYLKADYLEGK